MRNRVSKAFTLVEILIVVVILGILAAIVIPQFTNASEEAQVGNIQTQLQTIRSQVELFRVRNNGQSPVIVGASDASYSDLIVDGANSFGRDQEPYTRTRPVNPRNGLNSVTEDATPIATAASDDAIALATGWYINSATGEMAAAGFDEVPGSPTFGEWIQP